MSTSQCNLVTPVDPAGLMGPTITPPTGLRTWGGVAEIKALKHQHHWQFSPLNKSSDGWKNDIFRSQFRPSCDRMLLVEDDLTKAGMGFTAKLWGIALLIAMKDNRVLVEVRMVKEGNSTRSDGFERPRWCDRPPYTLQCLYQAWTNCPLPSANATIIRPGGRPLKTNRWPHAEPYIRTGLGRIHRQGIFWYGSKSSALREAGRFLFRPRPWVAAIADCVMSQHGLLPQRFLSVHIRHSVEKQKEGSKLGVKLPDLPAHDTLSVALAADFRTRKVFLQTASPVALEHFASSCKANGLELSFTNNSRSENDAWGGWKGGYEMEQALVGAVNAHIGAQAVVSVSAELSLWTHFLAWTYTGPPGETLGVSRACCPAPTCRLAKNSGSGIFQIFAAGRALQAGVAVTKKECKEHYTGVLGVDHEKLRIRAGLSL